MTAAAYLAHQRTDYRPEPGRPGRLHPREKAPAFPLAWRLDDATLAALAAWSAKLPTMAERVGCAA